MRNGLFVLLAGVVMATPSFAVDGPDAIKQASVSGETRETGKENIKRVADDVKGFYAGIHYTMAAAKPPVNKNFSVRMQPTSVDRGSGIGANLGYNFSKYLAMEGAVSSHSFNINEATYSNSSTSIKYVPDDPEMELTVVAFDVKVTYPGERFRPYVQIGYGQYKYKADFESQPNNLSNIGWGSITNETRFGGGVSICLDPSLFFDIKYVTSDVADITDIGLSYRF
jgi:opacity protein-like surface antigen